MSRNYLEAFVVLIVAAALGFFLVIPKYQELQEIRRQVVEKTAEIKNRQNYYADLAAMAADLDQYRSGFEKIDSALPDNLDAPALMSFAQAAALQSGLAVKNIDFGGASPSSPSGEEGLTLQKYGISIQLEGSYANFKNFLSIIERSSRLAAVDSISVKSSGVQIAVGSGENNNSEKAGEKPLDYEVKLSAHYYQ
jgi:Tfp pilus assembly protein PilO